MSYRNEDPRDYRGHQDVDDNNPDQYAQEHYGRSQFGPQQHADSSSGFGNRQFGQSSQGQGQYGQSRTDNRQRGWQGRDSREWRGGDWRANEWRDERGRGSVRFNPGNFDQRPFAQHPSGHAPFNHSEFGESSAPRYFGTGAQGYGGGPSFGGGTYGTADQRSDSPYFEESGFNRHSFEDAVPREPEGGQYGYRAGRDFGRDSIPHPPQTFPWAFGATRQGQQQRRYAQGPKGYQRSDERLREDISERLMHSHEIDSSDVTGQVVGAKVTLEGTVPTRFMKHAIEDVADGTLGVQDVDNRVRVVNARDNASAVNAATNASGAGAVGGSSGGLSSNNGRTTTTTGTRRDS